jgi:cytochrome c-type biogenesis protein CcmE
MSEELDRAKETEGVAVPARRRRAETEEQRDEGQNPWVRRGLVIGLAAVAAAIAGLVLLGMQDASVYSKPIDELLANKQRFAGRTVRAEGTLVKGSLVKKDSPCEYKFVLENKGARLPVRFGECVVPDTFKDVPNMDVGATVEGELKADGTFEATKIIAKCPSKYEMKEKQKSGEQMPHGPVTQAY